MKVILPCRELNNLQFYRKSAKKGAEIYETPPLCCAALSLKFLPWFPSRSRVHQPGACLGVKEWWKRKNAFSGTFLSGTYKNVCCAFILVLYFLNILRKRYTELFGPFPFHQSLTPKPAEWNKLCGYRKLSLINMKNYIKN